MYYRVALLVALALCMAAPVMPQPSTSSASQTKIVFLGTGNPALLPDRSGPATAIVVNGTAYLVDFGPGVVRRATAAFTSRNISALEPTRLRVAFVTHLHSDHTVGYPDLIFSTWTQGRRVPLEVYGPTGLTAMTAHLLEAFRVDIDTRTNANGQQREFPDGYRVNAHEIASGIIYKDANVTVTAFPTKHAMESYGYRFDTADRSIVISGDTNPTQATIDACRGCDVLIHEAQPSSATRSDMGRRFGELYHTSPAQLAELTRQAKPGLLIIYHQGGGLGTEGLFDDMRTRYSGLFAVARDLDVF
jgi:ribonuclease BN (tRNA processing enzyme)